MKIEGAVLVKNILDSNLEQKPTREGYGKGVVEAGKQNKNVVLLCADLTDSTHSANFKKLFPDRFVQMGVHEPLMAALAAGMSLAGKIPFIATFAMFCPGRAWEMVRTNICLNDANVKIIGSHTGVSVGEDGATHQAIEDIAIMRPIPNITIIVPCDAIEARKTTVATLNIKGPCYVRLSRQKSPVLTLEKTPFEIGKAALFRNGKDVAIIACGHLVHTSLVAAEELAEEGIDVMVLNSHTIKPLDEKAVLHVAQKCRAIVSVEEHQITGGLGGAVAEYLSKECPTVMEFIGVQNKFGESGSSKELMVYFKMDITAIKKAVKKAHNKKKRVYQSWL